MTDIELELFIIGERDIAIDPFGHAMESVLDVEAVHISELDLQLR